MYFKVVSSLRFNISVIERGIKMRRRKRRNNELVNKVNVLEAELMALKSKLNENSTDKGNECNGSEKINGMDIAKELIKKCFE